MRMTRIVRVLLILACVGIYGYSAVGTNRGRGCNISVDLGKPLSVVWPFEVAVVGDEGEKGLRIAANIGRGWRGEAGGEASYRFYIPEEGKYFIWAYGLWFDECANAVFGQIDDLEKAIIGNDPVYGQWHWVRGFDVHFKHGTHTIVLSNHSDHISLQKLLFTNSAFATPQDCNVVFSDIFYDGFDGCDQGNFGNWKAVCGKWGVHNPEQPMCFEQNSLTRRTEEDSFLIYRGDDWSDYSFNVAVRSVVSEDTDGSASLCFGLKDAGRYHQLRLRHARQPDVARMELSVKTPDQTRILSEFQVPWVNGQWHQVEITLNPGDIAIKVDDADQITTPVDYRITGGIGLRLEGRIDAYFDDIHIRQVKQVIN